MVSVYLTLLPCVGINPYLSCLPPPSHTSTLKDVLLCKSKSKWTNEFEFQRNFSTGILKINPKGGKHVS